MTLQKTFFAVVVLEFDDSCYVHVDAKQYRLASFSTRNFTLPYYRKLTLHEINETR